MEPKLDWLNESTVWRKSHPWCMLLNYDKQERHLQYRKDLCTAKRPGLCQYECKRLS